MNDSYASYPLPISVYLNFNSRLNPVDLLIGPLNSLARSQVIQEHHLPLLEDNDGLFFPHRFFKVAVRLTTAKSRFLWVRSCEIDFTQESSFEQFIHWYQCPKQPGDSYPRITDPPEPFQPNHSDPEW